MCVGGDEGVKHDTCVVQGLAQYMDEALAFTHVCVDSS